MRRHCKQNICENSNIAQVEQNGNITLRDFLYQKNRKGSLNLLKKSYIAQVELF